MDDTGPVQRLTADRPLRSGVLVTAFAGWNDAGEAATGAVDAIGHLADADPSAQIDPEEFFDFQANRPSTHLDPDVGRVLEWPHNRFHVADVGGRDLLLLSGTEPNLRWRTFANAVLSYATELEVRSIICVGALQVDAPHTRPVQLTGRGASLTTVRTLGVRRSDYEGPTGITGVLTHLALQRGFDTCSIWAGVPHYLAGTTYAAAAHSLADAVTRSLDIDVDLQPLSEAASSQQREIAEVVAGDDDLSTYVAELEERVDAEDEAAGIDELHAESVTGDELAAAFERYLKERDERAGEP
ncbi:MAG: PAC2 family protein [Actinobacteria bacterium]|nr:PAC2 family protein [Actinomycetota bacterium]